MSRALICLLIAAVPASAQVLDKQKLLDRETFWDNRDWDWYKQNIPFFECPDADIQTTYYYRWELLTKHLTYGSPNTGYVFTEFIDRPFWSGTYGAISCPAGHQLYEARWLRDPRYVRDYSRYWFRTPGAQPRRYSCWLADAIWAGHLVHPDPAFVKDLLPDLIKNYQGWERDHFVPEVGLFWQTGHDDGMEININSRQTKDTVRGAPGYRPTLNSYMYADALAIANMAALVPGEKRPFTEHDFRAKAEALKKNLQAKLWDPKREFFFPMSKQDEERDGFRIKAGSLTYQTGKFAGDPHGREEIGFVPWQFNLPDRGYEAAWKTLMSKDGFFADFGPTTVERHDPLFEIAKRCCEWSGNSWPYATTQTLKAMANLLQNYDQKIVTRDDYLKLLQVYAKTHRKNGKPYLAEACHPNTGSWEGNDNYNHSEHYFHSGFNDLIITGLVGLVPRDDDTIEVRPLAPESWDYFALDGVNIRAQRLSIFWDRTGNRYGLGPGFHVRTRNESASSPRLEPIRLTVSSALADPLGGGRLVNFAVNNDGGYYPRVRTSYSAPGTSADKLIDGNYWYHRDPPNRWTCVGSPNASDWVEIDFGVEREVKQLVLYFLDDGQGIVAPASYRIERWHDGKWVPVDTEVRNPHQPTGRRANRVQTNLRSQKIRITLTHRVGGRSGLTEVEAWSRVEGEVRPVPMPEGNLARGAKALASYTSRFDKLAMANDGVVNFNASPANRWTSYESPNASDWLEFEFGSTQEVGRVELAIYDDGGGVRAPAKYAVRWWDGKDWREVANAKASPETPAGGQWNEVAFDRVKTSKVRVVFTHGSKARSGVSEVLIWRE
jgi:hypothetical protein